jgi:pimeloyl-ACP methyl ester carboxylesterase
MDARERFEAPGDRLAVADRLVHVVDRGSGLGTIVFEAGVGGNALDWIAVQSMLPDRFRSIAYDRLGLGWSDAPAAARTPDRVVDELESLLGAIGADPPYLLVGHSLGCRYIRVYAVRHPESVAGLILVDGFHETWDEAVGPSALASFITARARLYRLAAFLSRIGLIRLLGSRAVSLFGPDLRNLPAAERARYAGLLTQPRSMDAAIDELRRSGESDSTLRDASFGALPVTVITHGVPFPDDAQERAWQDAQAEMAARSSRGRLVLAPGAGHSIMIASPGLVADAIDEMASACFMAPADALS